MIPKPVQFDYSSLDVYTRLEAKFKDGVTDLMPNERNMLEDLIIDRIIERVTRVSDEQLLAMADEESIF